MGLIVSIKHNNKMYVAADSNHVLATHIDTFSNKNNFKFWKIPGKKNAIMAYVGPYKRISNILKFREDLFEYGEITFESIVRHTVPMLVEMVKTYGIIKKDEFQTKGRYLIVTKDHMFVIEDDGFVYIADDFVALGSGKKIAYGIHQSTSETQSPIDEKITKLFKYVSEQDFKVTFPVVYTEVGSKSITIIHENSTIQAK